MVGFGILNFVLRLVKLFIFIEKDILLISLFIISIMSLLWWRDVIRERTYQGLHSRIVLRGLILGILLFIISEVFFFISFFWAFFHSSLRPTLELGSIWPPCGLFPFNPFQIPLLNTIILLGSGITVTWAHQLILNNNWYEANLSIIITWILGLYFLILQGMEYLIASFRISDSIYGSSFFIATGFHGFHVIVGSLFLFIIWIRIINKHISRAHHFGFEAAAWYWHFVDVVWLFLFSIIYWWGTYIKSIITFDFQSKIRYIFIIRFIEAILLVIIVYFVFIIFIYKNIVNMERISSYECGFEPYSNTRIFFSYRFFLISILFIIFDVEISLILPIPFLIEREIGIWIFIMFLVILVVGLIYEYICGSLDWLEVS